MKHGRDNFSRVGCLKLKDMKMPHFDLLFQSFYKVERSD
jgi:hypothetical protein